MKRFDELTNIELYQILRLRQEIFIVEQACAYSDVDGKDKTAHHLMAFEDGELVGCLRVLERGISFAEASIGRVVVAEGYRGRGIAKELMQRALDFTRTEWNEARIKISAQTYAIPFYAGVGFRAVSAEYLEDGIPHVDMICE